ncbi:MAG TPA: DUF4230 domain-containing protein [Flavobacteriales bacterium]|nr:DUF4230 domain-containing protein [Flavobacteriales bacterium]
MSQDVKRLLKSLIGIVIVVLIGFLMYHFVFNRNNDSLQIEDTPIHIESIRTIAEISTVSYKDEVVFDTVEYYKGTTNIFDPRDWNRLYNDNIKRRLTLIIKGEIKFGLKLTDGNFTIKSGEDTVWLILPSPELLDVIITPSKTEVFHEKGKWSDRARRQLEVKAKNKLQENAEKLKLEERAKENAERMFIKLINTDKHLIIEFDHDE